MALLWSLPRASKRTAGLLVGGFACAFQLQQLDAPAILSSDPFSYLIYARILALHGGNPYVAIPGDFPADPVLPYVYWSHVPSFYGPVWTLLSTIPVQLAGDQLGLSVLLTRGLSAMAALGSGWLIWRYLQVTAPERAVQGAALWLLNPLTVIESGLSGHNDSVLVLFLLLAAYALRSGWGVVAGAGWASAVCVKVVGALVLPVVLVLAMRQKAARNRSLSMGRGFLVGVALVVVGLMAVGRSPMDGAGVSALGADRERYTNSVHELILFGVRVALGDAPDDARTPLHWKAYPAVAIETTDVWSSSWSPRRIVGTLEAGQSVLVVGPPEQGWVRIRESANGRLCYVDARRVTLIETGAASSTPEADRWTAQGQLDEANRLVRAAGSALFLTGLVLILWRLWRGGTPEQAALRIFLLFLGSLATWIWPWYLLWPLAVAALVPLSGLAGLTVLLSAWSPMLYALFQFQGSALWWVFNGRSIVLWVIPVVGFSVAYWWLARSSGGARRHGIDV